MASGEERSQESSVVAVAAAVQNAPLLVLGSIAWWAIHYSLLWDARIAETYSAAGIHDIRFIVTVAATVVVLGSLTLISHRRPFAGLCQPCDYLCGIWRMPRRIILFDGCSCSNWRKHNAGYCRGCAFGCGEQRCYRGVWRASCPNGMQHRAGDFCGRGAWRYRDVSCSAAYSFRCASGY